MACEGSMYYSSENKEINEKLLAQLSEMEKFFAKARDQFYKEKKCDGCEFLEKLRGIDYFKGSSDEQLIKKALWVILKVAKCNGLQLKKPKPMPWNVPLKKPLKKQNHVNGAKISPDMDANNQTDVSIDCRKNQFRQVKENPSYTANHLTMELKFLSADQQRDGLEAVRLLKGLAGINDDQFGELFEEFLKGKPVEELRAQMVAEQGNQSAKVARNGPAFAHCRNCESDPEKEELKKAKEEVEFWQKKCLSEWHKLNSLTVQLNQSKFFMLQLRQVLEEKNTDDGTLDQNGIAAVSEAVDKCVAILERKRQSI